MFKKKYALMRKLRATRRMSAGSFWMEVGTRAISYLCAVIVAVMVICTIMPQAETRLNDYCTIAAACLAVLWCLPFVSLTRMRLRDAGFSAKAYFWLLLPVIGWIVFAGLMCVKGKQQTPENAVEVL